MKGNWSPSSPHVYLFTAQEKNTGNIWVVCITVKQPPSEAPTCSCKIGMFSSHLKDKLLWEDEYLFFPFELLFVPAPWTGTAFFSRHIAREVPAMTVCVAQPCEGNWKQRCTPPTVIQFLSVRAAWRYSDGWKRDSSVHGSHSAEAFGWVVPAGALRAAEWASQLHPICDITCTAPSPHWGYRLKPATQGWQWFWGWRPLSLGFSGSHQSTIPAMSCRPGLERICSND